MGGLRSKAESKTGTITSRTNHSSGVIANAAVMQKRQLAMGKVPDPHADQEQTKTEMR